MNHRESFSESEINNMLAALSSIVPELQDRYASDDFMPAFNNHAVKIVNGASPEEYAQVRVRIDAILEEYGCATP